MPSSISRQPMTYRDIHLRFSGFNNDDGTFKVWIEGDTGHGMMRPDDAPTCRYDAAEFWSASVQQPEGLKKRFEDTIINSAELMELGQRLADLALPPGLVRDLYKANLTALGTNEGLRLRLHIDADALAELPWEYMCLPNVAGDLQPTDFLALQKEISIVRTDTVESSPPVQSSRVHARIVAVFSSPIDLPHLVAVDGDRKVVAQASEVLNRVADKAIIEPHWVENPATLQALHTALQDGADLFHFSGHAYFDDDLIGYLQLEDDERISVPYPATKLAQLLRNQGVRLAVLNACRTAQRREKAQWGGIAPALTREHLPAVLANQLAIQDDHALLLITELYPLLFAGFTIDEAVYEARKAIFQMGTPNTYDWGAPVLYLRNDTGVLFPTPQPSEDDMADIPFIEVANTFKRIAGKVVEVEVEEMTQGRLRVRSDVESVEEGGNFTSVKIKKLGRS